MKTEITAHSNAPRTGRSYYLHQKNKVKVTLSLIRGDLQSLRHYQASMENIIRRCGGQPRRWLVGTLSGVVREWSAERQTNAGLSEIPVIAASADQARDFYLLWTQNKISDFALWPSQPVKQSWWPSLMAKAAQRLAARYNAMMA